MVVLFSFVFFHFSVKIYLPPDLPRNYRPVHYFRPVIAAGSENCHLQKVLEESTGKLGSDTAQGRHALNASQRREQLGETVLKGIDRYYGAFPCSSGPQFVYMAVNIWSRLERF